MRIALEEENLAVVQQCSVPVMFHGKIVGDYIADLMVEDRLIVELKAVQNLGKEHEVQLVNYLTATGIDDGLLINFGSSVKIKRKFRLYRTHQDQESSNRSESIYPISKSDLNCNL